MKLVTEAGLMVCDHELGHVKNRPRQDLVRISGQRILVDDDPENRTISGCPNTNPMAGIKPCQHTLKVASGYSAFVRITTYRVCMDSITGYTDGTPPATIHYKVRRAGQAIVSAKG